MVVTDDGEVAQPGDGQIGLLGVGGAIPLGYYKDEEKTAATFRTVNGRRYSIPGDYATVETDGTIRLLGRGSACINTGGEKVYPEEVELVLRAHPSVFDCVVVGVPDDRWGEMVVALVEPADDRPVDEATLAAHCRATLAGYKMPKQFVVLDSLQRSPAGKADYKLLRDAGRSITLNEHVARPAHRRGRVDRRAAGGEHNVILLDVRNADEWTAGHAPGAKWVPLARARIGALPAADEPPHRLRVPFGSRSAKATAELVQMGFDAVEHGRRHEGVGGTRPARRHGRRHPRDRHLAWIDGARPRREPAAARRHRVRRARVGGGITGCGVALDAASRGLRTALVDKGDFASGTSSKSSKLVHGGIRYLQQKEIGLVYEALAERQTLRTTAPHLVRVLPFLLPVFTQGRPAPPPARAPARHHDVDVRPHRRLRIGKLHKRVSEGSSTAVHADVAGRQHRRVVHLLRRAGRRRAPHAHDREDRGTLTAPRSRTTRRSSA